jgi:hypothetical protein
MHDPKALRLFTEIIAKTAQGRLPWESTADEYVFIATVTDKYVFIIRPYEYLDPHSGEPRGYPSIIFKDPDRELMAINSSVEGVSGRDLEILYEAVKRQALKIDEKIDDVLSQIENL